MGGLGSTRPVSDTSSPTTVSIVLQAWRVELPKNWPYNTPPRRIPQLVHSAIDGMALEYFVGEIVRVWAGTGNTASVIETWDGRTLAVRVEDITGRA
jgi:hypothetical protein